MVHKKFKLLQINGPLQHQCPTQQLRLLNMPVHQLTIILCQIQALKVFLLSVSEANYNKSLSLEMPIMEPGTQILLLNMSLPII